MWKRKQCMRLVVLFIYFPNANTNLAQMRGAMCKKENASYLEYEVKKELLLLLTSSFALRGSTHHFPFFSVAPCVFASGLFIFVFLFFFLEKPVGILKIERWWKERGRER